MFYLNSSYSTPANFLMELSKNMQIFIPKATLSHFSNSCYLFWLTPPHTPPKIEDSLQQNNPSVPGLFKYGRNSSVSLYGRYPILVLQCLPRRTIRDYSVFALLSNSNFRGKSHAHAQSVLIGQHNAYCRTAHSSRCRNHCYRCAGYPTPRPILPDSNCTYM